MTHTIDRATYEDYPAIATLVNNTRDGWNRAGPDTDNPGLRGLVNDLWRGVVYKATIGGTLAGIVVIDDTAEENDRTVVIRNLTIAPQFHGLALGRRLLEFAEDYARTQGYDVIRAVTESTDPIGLWLYRRFGYAKAGEALVNRIGHPVYYFYEKAVAVAEREVALACCG